MTGREVVITGIYETAQARVIDRNAVDVTLEALHGALADAGLTSEAVDGIAIEFTGPGGASGEPSSWARFFRQPMRWSCDTNNDAGGIRGLMKAGAMISAGVCDTVLMGGARAGRDATRREMRSLSAPFGAWGVPVYALIAQRHMHEFGTTPEQLAKVAAEIRNSGTKNPDAVMAGRGPYTVDDILASDMIATPFHLLDLSLVAQGGAAMVLTTRERAADLPAKGVRVLGAALEIAQASYVNPPLYREVGQLGRATAARLFAQAGVSPGDVDVFSLYDQNSFEVIRQFEVLGLCAEGEGGPLIEGANLSLGGDLPTNLDGGLLAHSWCGVQSTTMKIIECVRQLRGDAGGHQVDDAELVVATNAGPGTHYWGMGLFGSV